jgi:hypothetical protein
MQRGSHFNPSSACQHPLVTSSSTALLLSRHAAAMTNSHSKKKTCKKRNKKIKMRQIAVRNNTLKCIA